MGRLLRDISWHYSSRTTTNVDVQIVRILCTQYYTLHCWFLPGSGITPTVFTIGKVVPWAAEKIWKEYGIGLGYFLLQAGESMNAYINTLLEDSNWSNSGENDKWVQVMQHNYLRQFILPLKAPSPLVTQTPSHNQRMSPPKPGQCWCGHSKENLELTRCNYCMQLSDFEEALKEGKTMPVEFNNLM